MHPAVNTGNIFSTCLNGCELVSEFSKTVRFDFPRIPVIGALLLLILLIINYPGIYEFYRTSDGILIFAMITSSVLILGAAGISFAQVVSIATFNFLFKLKILAIAEKDGSMTSYEWFKQIQKDSTPISRRNSRTGVNVSDGGKGVDGRRGINSLNSRKIHATLHALEMEIRVENAPFGVQLEYYYSLYLFFLTSAIFSFGIALLSLATLTSIPLSTHFAVGHTQIVLDLIIGLFGSFGAIKARRMKEFLRVLLFNANRVRVLQTLSRWFQCDFPRSGAYLDTIGSSMQRADGVDSV